MKQKYLKRPSQDDFDKMTKEQQNLLLIQLKQEDTMLWQKQAAQIQVIAFWITLLGFIGWAIVDYLK